MTKLQYGDLIAFYPTSKMGELIRIVDSKGLGNYSHWATFIGYRRGIPLFIESHEGRGGVVILALKEWQNTYDIYRAKELKPRPEKDLLNLLGNGYNFKKIWLILKNRMFGTKLFGGSPDKPICTELCNFAYRYRLAPAGQATPYTLENSVELECIYKSNR